jgi:tripartite ATP-independent transporter DctP family solute receptor
MAFKDYVERKSHGAIEVQIYPNCQLGGQVATNQDVQQGVIQLSSTALNNITPFAPVMGIFDMPYLITEFEQYYDIVDKFGNEINKRMIEESGLRILIWSHSGWRDIVNSKRPVRTIGDLKGLRIRVPDSPIMIDTWKAWGCEPSPIAWDEVYTALEQDVIDGLETAPAALYDKKFYEHAPYVTRSHYKLLTMAYVINEKWLRGLPEDQQKIILAGGQFAQDLYELLENIHLEKWTEKCKKGGVKYAQLKDENIWEEKAVAQWPRFYKDYIGDHMDLFDDILKYLGRERPAAN